MPPGTAQASLTRHHADTAAAIYASYCERGDVMGWRMMRCILVCLSVLALPSAGWPSDACMALERWIDGQAPDMAGMVPGQCSMQIHPDAQVCRWDFAYRAEEAQAAFDAMSGALATCAEPSGALTEDQPVNHPDSYALHRYVLEGREVALSLKDKAALGKSLIFLRVTAPPPQ